jgi:hypothetical protein
VATSTAHDLNWFLNIAGARRRGDLTNILDDPGKRDLTALDSSDRRVSVSPTD